MVDEASEGPTQQQRYTVGDLSLAMLVGDKVWVPASLTQARYNVPGELMYGNGRPIWIPVIVNGVESNGSANVVLEWDGSVKLNVKLKDVQPRSSTESPTPDDLIQLEYPNEGSILYLLGDHFRRSQFLCRLGRSFIWINPAYRHAREIGCHRNSLADMSARLNGTSASPDIYSIAEEIRKTVSENLMNLSVLFRGSSGSGKTELSKYTLQYLLYANSPRHDKAVTENLNYIPLGHSLNPILALNSCEISKSAMAGCLVMDAFGTTPTEKNPTSSRLIRVTKLQYDLRGSLHGIEFLFQQFDQCRISAQNINESHPYNIFSWIVVGSSLNIKEELKFTSNMISEFETCALTTSPTYQEECQRNFQYLQHLLFSIGITEIIWNDILKILGIILHLQRLIVSGSDAATISAATKNHVAYAEVILGLEQGTLGPILLKRSVDMHGTKTFKNLSQEDATNAIFTLSYELYLRIFQYLLKQCNSHTPIHNTTATNTTTNITTPTMTESSSLLVGGGSSILQLIDFSGYEIFPIGGNNNLSQLIIHMTEEKMNEYFIQKLFYNEIEFLKNENILFSSSSSFSLIEKNILDCEPILCLIEKQPSISIFNLLEEACLLPRSNDNALLDKILSTHNKGKLIRTGGRQNKSTNFIIKHNFGDVLYDIDGFINQNKSKIMMTNDMKILFQNIILKKFPFLLNENDLINNENNNDIDMTHSNSNSNRRKNDKTLNKTLFLTNLARDQLKLLIDSIQGTTSPDGGPSSGSGSSGPSPCEITGTADPLMIFCIRGSGDIKSLTFDPSYTSSQIEFFNLSPLTNFTKKCYSQRLLYKEFYDRYRVMFPYHYKDLPWKFPSSSSAALVSSSSSAALVSSPKSEGKNLCKNLLEECAILGCLPHLFHDETITPAFGNNFLFSHSRLIEILELLRSQILQKYSKATVMIQSIVRMKKYSKLFHKILFASLKIQTFFRFSQQFKKYQLIKKSICKIQNFYKMKLLKIKYQQIKFAILKIEKLFYQKKYFLKFKKIQRGLFSFHSLVRGYVLRQQINSIIRAVIKLQTFAKDFLKRNYLFYYRRIAVVLIQKTFRGSYVRYLNKPIVRALKIRKNQRIGTLAIKKLQSKFRMLRIYRRFHEILHASQIIRSWALARKQRKRYLLILFLVQWLQNLTRRIIANNKINNLRVEKMLLEEYLHLQQMRQQEIEILNYSDPTHHQHHLQQQHPQQHHHQQQHHLQQQQQELLNLRIGGGYSRNAHDKFNRYIIGFDLNFDLSFAYPHGWIQTLIKFNQQLRQNGQKRLSQIAIGKNHTVLIDSNSNIYTFGLNDCGQLGHGNKRNESYPYQMNSSLLEKLSKSITSRVEVSCVCTGSDHTLLLTTSKIIYSWGSNRRGQLGHSNFLNSSLPRLVSGPKNVRLIACGSYHSACLADPGILHLWGARECLGRKADSDCSEAHTIPFFQKKRVQLLVCGDIHVTVRAGSNFYSWGLNTHGQLGIGGEDETCHLPTRSQGKSEFKVPRDDDSDDDHEEEGGDEDEDNFDQVSQMSHAKETSASAAALAIRRSGKNSVLPIPLSQSTFSSWTEADFLECQLVAGGRHMLLVLRNRVWCWGWNKYGQLGNGKTINVLSPIEVSLIGPKILLHSTATHTEQQLVTQKVSINASKIVSAIAGWRHSAVLTKGGVVYIWGLPQLHSSCELKLPTAPLVPSPSPSNNNMSADHDSSTIPPTTTDPLLIPHIVTFPSSLTSSALPSPHLSPVLGLFSCSSSSFSMTSLEIIEIDSTPTNLTKKDKFQSSRKVETIEFHNSATIQKEIKQRVRQELGPWSTSAMNKNPAVFSEASDISVASSNSSVYNRRGWGGTSKSQAALLNTTSSKFSSPSKTRTSLHVTGGARGGEEEESSKDQNIHSSNRSCEGNVTEEGLLKLFSPVKKESYQSSDNFNQSLDGTEININDYFNIPNDEDNNHNRGGDAKKEVNRNQRYRSERSNFEKDGALNSNMSLSSLQRKRRSSVAAMLHPENEDPDSEDQTSLSSKRSQRRASLALQRVNEKISHPNVSTTNSKTGDSLSINNSEKLKVRNPSKLDTEVNSLIQSARVRKESPTRSRISQSDNNSTASSKRKKEIIKGNGPKYSEDFDANESSLSHIAVSDLATMIQSIKKESLQQLSMSWRV